MTNNSELIAELVFDPLKPVMTRCGWAARIVCVDRDDPKFPIIALTLVRPGHGEGVDCYMADGRKCPGKRSDLDLVNVRVGKRFKAFRTKARAKGGA